MAKVGLHCYVSGKVQGVWYRASTQQRAVQLGLTGWVKNLPDGRVEVLAYGAEEKIHQLRDWLWQGPAGARVDEVVAEPVDWQECSEFQINRG